MNFKSVLYRAVNVVCRVDITRVLLLDASAPVSNTTPLRLIECKFLDSADLAQLLDDENFRITSEFVADFDEFGFTGVAAVFDGQMVGILFLAAHRIAARHNSGGPDFKGIGLTLPSGVHYLFKVLVKPAFRGQRLLASMIDFATNHLRAAGLQAIVTTTDWTNTSFLNSVRATGFRRCSFACEWIVATRHYYRLPAPLNPDTGKRVSAGDETPAIRFWSD